MTPCMNTYRPCTGRLYPVGLANVVQSADGFAFAFRYLVGRCSAGDAMPVGHTTFLPHPEVPAWGHAALDSATDIAGAFIDECIRAADRGTTLDPAVPVLWDD